jgi:2-polyprenyl-3-methyl-5-hydroxy-6-metoxy-1,4-benzoquinol methylase
MYTTSIYKEAAIGNFDWEAFFSPEAPEELFEQLDLRQIMFRLRDHLKENKFRLAFALNRVMTRLFEGRTPHNPRVLELGAATGFLTRWLLRQYGGTAILVDSSNASYRAYTSMDDDIKKNITYMNVDLFNLELQEQFDLVCSFGLIEHFEDKQEVIEVHKKFVAPGGMILILVPLDTPLTRAFLEVHPELNRGYRELRTEKEFTGILTRHGLQVIRVQASKGYVYDFIGAVCS